jgi:beta-lactamase superfamily II metal-dependent hydrolase
MTYTELPNQGVVFWPVGNGDSTTVVVDADHVLQIDIHDQVAADDDDAVVAPVIDRLAEILPRTSDDQPYLSVFALTHADVDHCRGFGDLLDSDIVIGELWATPRLWRELSDDAELVEDAQRFQDEAERRVEATLKAVKAGKEPASGDRIRIIGYDLDEDDHAYCDLSADYRTYPGEEITTMDGDDVSDHLSAFVHAPFKDDCAGARNETSLALHLTLQHPDHEDSGGVLLFGDLSYETIKKIFTYSAPKRPERLAWDVMLASHHGSKKVMYAPDDDGDEELKQDILDMFEDAAGENGYVVISSRPFRDVDPKSANPPHLQARDAYDDIAPTDVLCTGEYPDADDPRPVVFELVEGVGLQLLDVEEASERAVASRSGAQILKSLAMTAAVAGTARIAAHRARRAGLEGARAAVKDARGGEPESLPAVGFGQH